MSGEAGEAGEALERWARENLPRMGSNLVDIEHGVVPIECPELVAALQRDPELEALRRRASITVEHPRDLDEHAWRQGVVIPIVLECVRVFGPDARGAGLARELLRAFALGAVTKAVGERYRALVTGLELHGVLRAADDVFVRRPDAEEVEAWSRDGIDWLPDVLRLEPFVIEVPDTRTNDDTPQARVELVKAALAWVSGRPVTEAGSLTTYSYPPTRRTWRRARGGALRSSVEQGWAQSEEDVASLVAGAVGPNGKLLQLVMKRSARLGERSTPGDAVVDAWVVLEAIYTESIALRAAVHLGRGEERVGLYRFLQRMRGARATANAAGAASELAVDRLARVARRCVLALARERETFVPEALDERVLE